MKAVRYTGFFNEASGLGQAARSHALALHAAGVPVQARAVGLSPHGPVHFELDTRTYPELAVLAGEPSDCAVELIHTLPPAFHTFTTPGAYRIGVTVWETDTLPASWRPHLADVDELWVPSSFVAQGFAAVSEAPVQVIPHPVPVRSCERASLPDIPDDLFVFLAVLEWHDRKNPEGLLRAFHRAFAGRREVALVLKIGNLFFQRTDVVDGILERACRGLLPGPRPRVFVIQEPLSPATLLRLYQRADAYLSLHRSEGFGLCLAEAMATGRPVVATGFAGSLDYMTDQNAFLIDCHRVPAEERFSSMAPLFTGMSWAEPHLDDAVDKLRACVRETALRRDVAERGFVAVRDQLDPNRVGHMMRQRLEAMC